jgi:hypothetical protein
MQLHRLFLGFSALAPSEGMGVKFAVGAQKSHWKYNQWLFCSHQCALLFEELLELIAQVVGQLYARQL